MRGIKKFIHQWSWIILLLFCSIGLIYPYIGVVAIICMLAPSIAALFNGRVWCGNFCPRGSFSDIILSKISLRKKIPNFIKATWFKILFFIILMGAFTVQLILAWGSFYLISLVFIRMILITTILTFILGILFKPRTWCHFCPMGSMAYCVAKLNIFSSKQKNVTFKNSNCISCKICNKSCPMEIDILASKKNGHLKDANCLKCSICVAKCPKDSLKL